MNGFLKFILWVIVLAVVGYFGYEAYTKWWDTEAASKKKEEIVSTIGEKTGQIKKTVEEKAAEAKAGISSYTGEVVGEAREGVIDYVKRKIGEGISAVGESISGAGTTVSGVTSTATQAPALSVSSIIQNYYSTSQGSSVAAPTSSNYFVPPSPTAIIARTSIPLVFSINAGTKYSVDWGDGTKEEGVETQGNIKLIEHTWKQSGDYNVVFSIRNGTEKEYTFPIRVY